MTLALTDGSTREETLLLTVIEPPPDPGIGEEMYKFLYIKDHLGSVRAVMADDGSVKESYDFYPFGLKMPGRVFVSGTAFDKNLFTGKELDAETGDYYFGFRYYNPAIGKWNSVDALADFYKTQGTYNYCFNSPANYIDPIGLGNNPTKIPRYPTSNSEVYSNGYEYYIDGVQVSRGFLYSFLQGLPGGGGYRYRIEGHWKYGGTMPQDYVEWLDWQGVEDVSPVLHGDT